MKISNVYYELFLKYGDPMCLVLARDFERTENLKRKIELENNNDLTL